MLVGVNLAWSASTHVRLMANETFFQRPHETGREKKEN